MNRTQIVVLVALSVAITCTGSLGAQDAGTSIKGTKVRQTQASPVVRNAAPEPVATASPAAGADRADVLDSIGGGMETTVPREDPALVALGSMGAANLYYSYLAIGSIADGFVGGTYQPRVAISVANEAIFMNDTTRKSLEQLAKTGLLAEEDRKIIEYLIGTYDVLNRQARALIRFVSDRNDDGTAYQDARKEALARIVKVFGMK